MPVVSTNWEPTSSMDSGSPASPSASSSPYSCTLPISDPDAAPVTLSALPIPDEPRYEQTTPDPATMSTYERRRARLVGIRCDAGTACIHIDTPGGGHSSVAYFGYCGQRCYFEHLRSLGEELPRCKNWEAGCKRKSFRGRQCNGCRFRNKKKKNKTTKTNK